MTLATMSSSPTLPTLPPGALLLADLPANQQTTILGLAAAQGQVGHVGLVQRLAELGFMTGETISVLRRGPGGREPIAVQVGDTVFALRRHEARCVQVKATP